jgi:hypothetical protein
MSRAWSPTLGYDATMQHLKSFAIATSLIIAVLATTATSQVQTPGLSNESDPVEVAIGPGATVSLQGLVAVSSSAAVSGGTVGLSIDIDPTSSGSVTITLSAAGNQEVVDIIDAATQGQTRIASNIFANCAEACEEPVSVLMVRTDDAGGDLQATLVLDGAADAAADATGSVTVSLSQ